MNYFASPTFTLKTLTIPTKKKESMLQRLVSRSNPSLFFLHNKKC